MRCKEIHVAGADPYRDPDDVPTDFEAQRSVYYAALGLPSDPGVFIAKLRDGMRSELQTFNDGLGRNDAVTIRAKRAAGLDSRRSRHNPNRRTSPRSKASR